MKDSKLIQLYNCLDRKALEAWHKWLKSPLHNQNEEITKLFEYIGSRRKKTATSLAKRRVYEYIFPKEDYNDMRMRRLMSKALKVLELFVQYLMYESDVEYQQKKLIEYTQRYNLETFVRQTIQKSAKGLQQKQERNFEYYYDNFRLEQLRFEQASSQGRMRETNLQAIFDTFSTAFIIETLRYATIALSHQNVYNTVYEIPLLEAVLALVQQEPYLEMTTVQIYYEAYMTQASEDVLHFEQLKSYLKEYYHLLPPKEVKVLYTMAINYCIKKINTNESKHYIRQVWELYRQGTADGSLLENGVLGRFTYTNTVTAAIRLEKYDWIEEYINTYHTKVEAAYRDNYTHFNTSKLHFARGQYDEAMQLLTQVEYDDIFLNMSAKTMLIKIYYEKESVEALLSLFHSFTIFLQRKLVLGYHRQNYLNIIKMTRKLLDLAPYDKAQRAIVREQIETIHPLTEREWLLQQLDAS